MISFRKIDALKKKLSSLRALGKSIGFVPTMGALHQGHLELIKRAVDENDFCVCSIFVNPIQFNNKKDLEKYPCDLETDFKKLKSVGCQLVFVPDNTQMYPEPDLTQFDFGYLDKILEGEFRPGHFNGVAVVVKKLFEIIEPQRAYFGEKDFQQLAIINQLVKVEKMKVEIIPCPIIREADGLAMSSRNARLTDKERDTAPAIYQNLLVIKNLFNGQNAEELKRNAIVHLNSLDGMKVEYLEIVDDSSLLPLQDENATNINSIALIATFLGEVRLIDNIRLG